MAKKTLARPIINNGLPIPAGFNSPQSRMEINLYAYSDVTAIDISLYECRGLYWYSFTIRNSNAVNSLGFFSLQNCALSLRATVRGLGFVLDNPECLSRFVRSWNRQGRSAPNASYIRRVRDRV